ncbi:L-threonylcarbamoyladenylate synthase [Entomoplasma freundtii]|uniref:L-threonylcarbamoyladenylate synthase n=1 Tax=Entomoplasma freundtii TaxID=74700 RepID=A0A2K8NQK7_9MOLU|nr:Sua5/YciO/YrdC/YwlC family protein [Entomoplasma freundtii]ATZ16120.1 tRNA threonylcarbamoyladenosine biosynthesis protein [Entomoplasma freundtii]TDY56979.1 L-threonylcarbamoyladenylate synthase [Entomoplasma freundtii]
MLDTKKIEIAIQKLRAHEIVILPTDTVYGFSTTMTPQGAKKINHFKKAPLEKPLIALFANLEQVEKHVKLTKMTRELLLTPEPTTVISPLLDDSGTLAVRIVKRPDIQKIIKVLGPLWSTSVNFHQEPTIVEKKTIQNNFSEIYFFPDNENCQNNAKPSRIFNQLTQQWIRK